MSNNRCLWQCLRERNNLLKKKGFTDNITPLIRAWCNGSTKVSKTFSQGSNPCARAKKNSSTKVSNPPEADKSLCPCH